MVKGFRLPLFKFYINLSLQPALEGIGSPDYALPLPSLPNSPPERRDAPVTTSCRRKLKIDTTRMVGQLRLNSLIIKVCSKQDKEAL